MFDLESLGITKAELCDRVVERISEKLLTSTHYDEDGEEYASESQMRKKLREAIKRRVDEKVAEIATEHVLPKVGEMVENLCLQETNKWGEKTGAPLTFIEYLVERADKYLTETVDSNGETQQKAGYGFRPYGTRVSQLVSKHLDYEIKQAMQQAVQAVNHSLSAGLAETVKIKLAEIAKGLEVKIRTT